MKPARLEPPYPLQGRRDGQIDLPRKLRHRDAAVLLKPREKLQVYPIEPPVAGWRVLLR